MKNSRFGVKAKLSIFTSVSAARTGNVETAARVTVIKNAVARLQVRNLGMLGFLSFDGFNWWRQAAYR
jgi:hypothetical protein